MKQLENILTLDGGHTATLVKRNNKAAIYKRETAEGQFVSFEVFAIKSKDGAEVYPNQKAVQAKWAFCPMSEERANVWFDRIMNGDVTIPDVDPVTNEPLNVDTRSLDDLPDVNVSVDVSAPLGSNDNPIILPAVSPTDIVSVPVDSVPAVEVPTVEDPTVPDVEVPEVTPTMDGGVLVPVAKVSKGVLTMVIPSGEFTQADFANANGLPERGVVWSKLDALVKVGRLTKRFGSNGKGRPKAYFTEIATMAVSV
jgi:hypothetical protein